MILDPMLTQADGAAEREVAMILTHQTPKLRAGIATEGRSSCPGQPRNTYADRFIEKEELIGIR
jgi:hypothetical protein